MAQSPLLPNHNPNQLAEDELLDASFLALMTQEPEPDEPTDADVQPKLRYNFPKSSFEAFCRHQVNRVASTQDFAPTSQGVTAIRVRHVAGAKKPSLSQQEMEGHLWTPRHRKS